ncbi:hypothetical protein UY3_02292 [Chelonia mydas]|uniref:Uncharacterized protein n=1 Tax=Chelonia mydas TaxID=8469 RepID=M7CHQ5_CHEMY|nr:hypothetical protein UY3_02292 [Chelonia mydas]
MEEPAKADNFENFDTLMDRLTAELSAEITAERRIRSSQCGEEQLNTASGRPNGKRLGKKQREKSKWGHLQKHLREKGAAVKETEQLDSANLYSTTLIEWPQFEKFPFTGRTRDWLARVSVEPSIHGAQQK